MSSAVDTGAGGGVAGRGEPALVKQGLLRRAMARRMVVAAQVPCFYLRTTADVTALLSLRASAATNGSRPTVNDFVVRAAALALRAHPEVNAAFADGAVERFARVNVGVAVAIPDGLVVPAVYDADRKSPARIHDDTRALVDLARRRKLGREVLEDATFSVSNLGMFGIEDFDPLINPPQAAILGVGTATALPGDRHGMRLTLGCDHRVLTGAEGAVFLRTLKDGLEAPGRLVPGAEG